MSWFHTPGRTGFCAAYSIQFKVFRQFWEKASPYSPIDRSRLLAVWSSTVPFAQTFHEAPSQYAMCPSAIGVREKTLHPMPETFGPSVQLVSGSPCSCAERPDLRIGNALSRVSLSCKHAAWAVAACNRGTLPGCLPSCAVASSDRAAERPLKGSFKEASH